MLPVSVISESGQAKTVDGPSSVVASTVADGMLEWLWQDLPELEVLLELKFEEVMVLESGPGDVHPLRRQGPAIALSSERGLEVASALHWADQ